MVSEAKTFINSLTKEQQLKAVYPFDADERYNFHFFPKNDRKGISVNELSEAQRDAAFALLRSGLSDYGYRKTTEIMQLEKVLKALEKRADNDNYRDPGKYFFTIFGIPADKTIWGWRFEGHHITFNFSTENNKLLSGTPGFFGTNPAIVPDGPSKGKQILKEEANMGFDILHSLSKDQLGKALIRDNAPNEIISFITRKPAIENNEGINYGDLTPSQQQKLLELIRLYIFRYTKTFAEGMLKDIQRAGINNIHFVWMGAQYPAIGKAHYYRIQGPTFIIEYDNSQNNANHVHSVIRDLKNDFGGDILTEHYKNSHAGN
jgi:hypothetical protein